MEDCGLWTASHGRADALKERPVPHTRFHTVGKHIPVVLNGVTAQRCNRGAAKGQSTLEAVLVSFAKLRVGGKPSVGFGRSAGVFEFIHWRMPYDVLICSKRCGTSRLLSHEAGGAFRRVDFHRADILRSGERARLLVYEDSYLRERLGK